jgi:hypothetical protein
MRKHSKMIEKSVTKKIIQEMHLQSMQSASANALNFNYCSNDILDATAGVDFKIISTGSGTIMQEFIRQYFKNPISSNASKCSMGGEQVLTTLHATEKHPSSYHLMHFAGEQDKHFHAGPRLLNIFASKPWFLYAGGSDLTVLNKKRIPLAKIAFPGNSFIQLRFSANLIHGFEGADFAAISVHYTDMEEVAQLALHPETLTSGNVMEKLTTIIDQDRIEIISAGAIPYSELMQINLLKNAENLFLHTLPTVAIDSFPGKYRNSQ